MLSTFVTLALVLAPTLTQVSAFDTWYPTEVACCSSLSYAWESSAVWPLDIVIVDPATPCDDPLIDVGEVSGTSANTTINIKPGQKIQLSLLDADDNESWSAPITVTDGGDYSCFSSKVAASLSEAAASASSTVVSSSTSSAASSSVSATALIITGSSSPTTVSVGHSSSTKSSSSSAQTTGGVQAVGAVGTGSESGAAALAVPFTFLAASIAAMLFL